MLNYSALAAETCSELGLQGYQRQFAQIEMARGYDYYARRIAALEFTKRDTVLDVGCGVGQWTLALTRANRHATGIDPSVERIQFARAFCARAGSANVTFDIGKMEQLPYPDESFDAVMCIGALMFSAPETALRDIYRVLRPRGRLYVQGSSVGWTLRTIIARGLLGQEQDIHGCRNLSSRLGLMRAHSRLFCRTAVSQLFYKEMPAGVFLTEKTMRRMLDRTGFSLLQFAGDGEIGDCKATFPIDSQGSLFYPASYLGTWCVFEMLAVKPMPTSSNRLDAA